MQQKKSLTIKELSVISHRIASTVEVSHCSGANFGCLTYGSVMRPTGSATHHFSRWIADRFVLLSPYSPSRSLTRTIPTIEDIISAFNNVDIDVEEM
jgi:hypothetical protein